MIRALLKKKKQLIPTHTHSAETPRQVTGMFSLPGIHTSRSSEQRVFSWVRRVCECVCKPLGSYLGLTKNLRPCGSVVVAKNAQPS